MIRPEIFEFELDLGLKLGQTKRKISGTVPTNRHTTTPNDSGPILACFDDDPKLVNCEVAPPNSDRHRGVQPGPLPGPPGAISTPRQVQGGVPGYLIIVYPFL